MSFNFKNIKYGVVLAIFAVNHSYAQNPINTFADMEYISNSNPWLKSNNAAGLSSYDKSNISSFEGYFKKANGGFRNFYQSNNSREYGINTESIGRISDKVVLAGGLSYLNNLGKNMTGSAFINPNLNPFDIVEADQNNAGSKSLELYNLNGAVSAKLSQRLSLGGKINYQTGNYAKQRDLRHINKLLNMDASVGLLYQLTNTVEVGANYNYNRRIESLNFRVHGNTDRNYVSLISYGIFYGENELFSQSGFTASSEIIPLRDITQGASAQINFKISPEVKLYNQFTYGNRNGFYGDEGTGAIKFTQHKGDNLSYMGTLSVKKNQTEHHVNLSADYSLLKNSTTVYRRETTAGGVNQIVYYGSNEVAYSEKINLGVDYNIYLNVKNNQPKWSLNFIADYFKRDQQVNIFPYYRNQALNSYQFLAQAKRHIQREKDAFTLGLGVGFGNGSGKLNTDGVITKPSDQYIPPSSQSHYLNHEFEYLTANRINSNLSFKYTRALENNMGIYVKANYALTYAPSVNFIGSMSNIINTSVGFTF